MRGKRKETRDGWEGCQCEAKMTPVKMSETRVGAAKTSTQLKEHLARLPGRI